jgi:site-specific DNA recombinase
MRAVCYPRVSSQIQKERHTIASQLRALPEFIKRQGWELVAPVETYMDDGRSAAAGKLDKRAGFQRLLADAAAGRFDVVVVIDQDRLSRSEDLAERGLVLGAFQQAGVQVAVASTGQILDLNTFEGDLLSGLGLMLAAAENRKRRERTIRGTSEAISKGRKPAGATPYGLRYDKAAGTFSIDKAEAKVVREIYRRIAAGESCREIEYDFNARGVPTGPARKNRSQAWIRERIYKLATSPTYRGIWTVNKSKKLSITVPAIIDDALWYRVQDALSARNRYSGARTKQVYLAAGLARCQVCGEPIVIAHGGAPKKDGGYKSFYMCQRRRRPAAGAERCTLPMRSVRGVDERIWNSIEDVLVNKWDMLQARVQDRRKKSAENRSSWARDLKSYAKRLADLAKAESAMLARFRRGKISEAAMDRELDEIERERAFLTQQVETARAAASKGAKKAPAEELLASLAGIRKRLKGADQAAKRAVVTALVAEITLGAEPVLVHLALDPARIASPAPSCTGELSCRRKVPGATAPLVTLKLVA